MDKASEAIGVNVYRLDIRLQRTVESTLLDPRSGQVEERLL